MPRLSAGVSYFVARADDRFCFCLCLCGHRPPAQSAKSDEEEAQVARGLGFDPYAVRRA